MAAAAEDQTRLNILGLFLLAGTLWFTGRAAVYARDAAKATRDSAIAAEVSAAAADKTVKATVETAEASKRSADAAERALRGLERPYLFPHIEGAFHINRPRQGSVGRTMWPRAEVIFTNHGRVPALPLALSLDIVHLTRLPDDLPDIPNTIIDPNTVIRPQDETRGFRRELPLLDEAAVDSIVNGRSFIWFYGCLTYLSPTGDQYDTEFCWCYNGLSDHFGPYDQHNRIT